MCVPSLQASYVAGQRAGSWLMADEERVEADYLHRTRRNTGEDVSVKLHKASNATVSLTGLKSLGQTMYKCIY